MMPCPRCSSLRWFLFLLPPLVTPNAALAFRANLAKRSPPPGARRNRISEKTTFLRYKLSDDDESDGNRDEDEAASALARAAAGKLQEHHQTHQPLPLAMPGFHEAEELWSLEWHDSFVRNGLVDFVPPLTSTLSCLLVGDGIAGNAALGAAGAGDDFDGEGFVLEEKNDSRSGPSHDAAAMVGREAGEEEAGASLLRRGRELISTLVPHQTDYDCILDRGLMNELLVTVHNDGSVTDVGLLLLEATRHIREHGVYVVETRPGILSAGMKEYMVNAGKLMGMEWMFDLDGISDDEVSVSVARKYFTGDLPSFGRLANVESRIKWF